MGKKTRNLIDFFENIFENVVNPEHQSNTNNESLDIEFLGSSTGPDLNQWSPMDPPGGFQVPPLSQESITKIENIFNKKWFEIFFILLPTAGKTVSGIRKIWNLSNPVSSTTGLCEITYLFLNTVTLLLSLCSLRTGSVGTSDLGQITFRFALLKETMYSFYANAYISQHLLTFRGGAWTAVPPVELPRASKIYTAVPLPDPSMNLIEPNCLGRAIESNPRLIEPAKKIAGYLTWDKK